MPTTALVSNPLFLVDKRLGAVPIDRLLDVRTQLRFEGRIDRPMPAGAERPVLSGGQALQPDLLYAAEHTPTLRYYLPQYRVSTDVEGRPAVELRFDASGSDAVGSLALTLTWSTPPVAAGLELRMLEHRVVLCLRYRVPVQPTDAAAGAVAASGFENQVALEPLVPAGNQLARSVTRIADRAMFDAIYQALRSADEAPTLELRIGARVGVQTWRQVLVGRPAEIDQTKVMWRNGARFTEMLRAEPAAAPRSVPLDTAARVRIQAAPAREMRLAAAVPARTFVAMPTTRLAAAPMMTTATPTLAVQPRIADAAMLRPTQTPQVSTQVAFGRMDNVALREAVSQSDLEVGGRRVVPIRIALDPEQRPAVVDTDLECRQTLPFCFDPRQPVNGGVFVAEGYTASIHLLLPIVLSKDGRIYRVFQDNLMRDVVHVAPSEFRLQRDASTPFLPSLSFLASDFGTTDNATDADLMFRVAMAYRLEPWLDPTVLELARAALAEQRLVPRFTTSIAADAKLTLELDLLGAAQARSAARIDIGGVEDALDLDHATFVRLWRERLAPAGGGVGGRVEYTLFDGTQAQVPVRLSLWDASNGLLDVAFLGPVAEQPGRLRVQVRNRIESPVEIVELPGEVLPGGIVVHPVDPASAIGKTLQPQGSLQIDYDSGPAAAAPADFDPSVLGRATPKLDALLRLLMVTPGYASLGFGVTLKAADGSFTATAGTEPITGLLVEFDDGTRVTLTPQITQIEVSLVGSLIEQLMGRPNDSQRYLFRVTNLYAGGEGARTSWTEGHGGTPLQVGAAQVQLDF